MKRLFFFILFLACLLIAPEIRAQGTAYQIISGTLARRPTGCSIIGAVDVYAATDNSTLYICKAANTWGAGISIDGSSGSGTVNSGLINQLAWYAASGTTVSGLTTANNGVLVTSAGGVPSISSTLPSGITLVAPALGTPASGVATNLTGTAAGLTAGNVTTNANLTGPITSVGNATSIASQTGTGTKFVVDTNPVLVGPTLGIALATSINGLTITTSSGTFTLTNLKTFTVNNTLTLAGTDSSTLNIGAGGTLGTAAFQNTGTSGANLPFLNGNNTHSGINTFTPAARSSGAASYFTINIPADTNQTLSTEAIGYQHVAAIRQWATGNFATQRENVFNAPTYGFVGASTITTAVNFEVNGAPILGTNATFTNKIAARVVIANAGDTGLVITANGGSTSVGNLLQIIGTAGANALVVDRSGNTTFGGGASLTGNGSGIGFCNTGGVGATCVIGGSGTNRVNTGFFNTLDITKVSAYNGVNTAGWGVPAIQAAGRATAQTGANASVATYTVGAADGSFEISANVLVTTATTHAFTVTVAYTDEGNTARVLTLSFSQLTGTFLTSIANTGGAVPYEGVPLHIRCKASTSITIATTGTFTSVTYNIEGIIRQLS